MVEKHLLMMQERIASFGARRVAVDSVSVFLHKIKDPQVAREKTFQLATIMQNVQAVGFFAIDIPYGTRQLSRFGVEETVVDGVILLSSTEEGLERQRYLEVYKLRNTSHAKGRHSMVIGDGGIHIYPRYSVAASLGASPQSVDPERRLPTGVPGLDAACGGGLLERSVTLVSGSAGIGKSTLGLQFIAAGLERGEPGLYVSLEEGAAQILAAAETLGLSLARAIEEERFELLYLSRDQIQASQFLAILADKIQSRGVRRLVLDGVSHIVPEGDVAEDLRQLLFALVVRFKNLGVTSLLTFETTSMYATGAITDHGFSPVADNILLLRYRRAGGEDHPTLSVVKTRGSAHDRGTYDFSIAEGGLRLGARVVEGPEDGAAASSRPTKRTRR
jgi:circadian clock protein KaiC